MSENQLGWSSQSTKKKISFVAVFVFAACPITKICCILLENIKLYSTAVLTTSVLKGKHFKKQNTLTACFLRLVLQNEFSISADEKHSTLSKFVFTTLFHDLQKRHYNIYAFNPHKATCYYLTSIKDQQVSRNVNLHYLCVTEGQYQWIPQDNSISAHAHPFAHRKVKYNTFPKQKHLRNQSVSNTQPTLQILCWVYCMRAFAHQQEELFAWSCAKHLTLSHTTSLSLNWRNMDLTDGPLGE